MIDNGKGAETAFHVSPTVSAKPTLTVDGSSAILDTDAGEDPGAVGTAGMVQGIEGHPVGWDTNEN